MIDSISLPAFDPICGMSLEAGQIAATCTFIGRTYAFCCKECRDIFVHAPEAYVARLAHEPGASACYRCPHRRQRL